jgi:isochorismate synthase EntC
MQLVTNEFQRMGEVLLKHNQDLKKLEEEEQQALLRLQNTVKMEKVVNYKVRRDSTPVKLVKKLAPTPARTVNGPNFGFYPNTGVSNLKSRNP